MGRCDCGVETDWQEIGSTWLCVACRDEEIEAALKEMNEGLEKMERAELSLNRLRVDTLPVHDLFGKLKNEIARINKEA